MLWDGASGYSISHATAVLMIILLASAVVFAAAAAGLVLYCWRRQKQILRKAKGLHLSCLIGLFLDFWCLVQWIGLCYFFSLNFVCCITVFASGIRLMVFFWCITRKIIRWYCACVPKQLFVLGLGFVFSLACSGLRGDSRGKYLGGGNAKNVGDVF